VEDLPPTSSLESTEGVIDGEALRALKLGVAIKVAERLRGSGASQSGALPQMSDLGSDVEVVIRVVLRSGVAEAELARSSGHPGLDERARQAVMAAMGPGKISGPLAFHSVSFNLPVIFSQAALRRELRLDGPD
jgi:hypothetical protein